MPFDRTDFFYFVTNLRFLPPSEPFMFTWKVIISRYPIGVYGAFSFKKETRLKINGNNKTRFQL